MPSSETKRSRIMKTKGKVLIFRFAFGFFCLVRIFLRLIVCRVFFSFWFFPSSFEYTHSQMCTLNHLQIKNVYTPNILGPR